VGRIEDRRERQQSEQDELDIALSLWVHRQCAETTDRLLMAAKAYLGIQE